MQLVVGNENTSVQELHAHESILCQLPFFRKALQGNPKGASAKIVRMPEDDPEIVGALVEYLYKGDYNSSDSRAAILKAKSTSLKSESNVQRTPLEAKVWRKWFHARVYVLGEKYGYRDLCYLAKRKIHGLRIILDKSTAGLFVEYLMMIYEIAGPQSGLRIRWSAESTVLLRWDSRECARWVGSVWHDINEGKQIQEAFARCPELAVDMLRLISISLAALAEAAAGANSTTITKNCNESVAIYEDLPAIFHPKPPRNPYVGRLPLTF